MVGTVLFDLDGTLIDSAGDLREAANRMLGEQGLRAISEAEIKAMIGDGAGKLVERALAATGGDMDRHGESLARFLALYEANSAALTRPYPGAVAALERLAAEGFTLGLVTNKPHRATLDILDALDLARFFGTVIGGDSLKRRKPWPDPVLAALDALGAAPAAALMVGDNHHDVDAAHAAGLRAVAVTYGYCHRPPAELGADWLIDSLAELPPIAASLRNG